MRYLLATVVAILLAGSTCIQTPVVQTEPAHMSIVVMDTPYPVDSIASAIVTIQQIDLRRVNEKGDEVSTKTVYQSNGAQFELVGLRDGNTALLKEVDIDPGEYDQVRVCVGDATVTLTDGRTFPLKVPSGDSSGIKLFTDFAVTSNTNVVMFLDVDMQKAFKPIPDSVTRTEDIRGFMFMPSLSMSAVVLPTVDLTTQ